MCVHDIYRRIRADNDREEIERAIDEVKGRPKLTVKDFLPR